LLYYLLFIGPNTDKKRANIKNSAASNLGDFFKAVHIFCRLYEKASLTKQHLDRCPPSKLFNIFSAFEEKLNNPIMMAAINRINQQY
jgi:hypothetical protein